MTKMKELLGAVRHWSPDHVWEVSPDNWADDHLEEVSPDILGRPAVGCFDCGLTVVLGGNGGLRYSFKEDGRVQSPITITTLGDVQRLPVPQDDCDVLEHVL